MSKAKQKGTAAETAVVRYLNSFYPPEQEQMGLEWRRETSKGANDEGDVFGPGTSIEVKNRPSVNPINPDLMANAEKKAKNSGRLFWSLVSKPKGYGDAKVSLWPSACTLAEGIRMFGIDATVEDIAALAQGKKMQEAHFTAHPKKGRTQLRIRVVGTPKKYGLWDLMKEQLLVNDTEADMVFVVARRLGGADTHTTDPSQWYFVTNLGYFSHMLQHIGLLPVSQND